MTTGQSEATASIYALAERLKKAGETSQQAENRTLMEAATFIAGEMKARCPVDTGNLRDSIGVRMVGEKIIIGPDMTKAPYAGYVEFGTRPHEIRPKTAKALKFTMGGKTVYARVVHHPGTRGAHYVSGAFEAWLARLGSMAAETGAQLITDPGSVS